MLGVIFAYSTVHLIVVRLPRGTFPNEANFHVHLPVLAFSVGPSKQECGKKPEENPCEDRYSNVAIMGFVRTESIPLGYNPHNTVSLAIPLRPNSYVGLAVRRQYFEQLRDKISELPQVTSAAIGLAATPPNNGFRTPYQLLGGSTGNNQQVAVELVDARYFSTLQIPLVQGRVWNTDELMRGAPLAVVNEAFVKNCFNNGQILGQSIKMPLPKDHPPELFTTPGADGWRQIVGVVGNALNDGLEKPVGPAVYLPYPVLLSEFTQIFVRTNVDPQLLEHTVRAQIAKVDPQQQALWTEDEMMEEALSEFTALSLIRSRSAPTSSEFAWHSEHQRAISSTLCFAR